MFRDLDAIPLGVDFREHIRKVLDSCRIMLVVIGPDWLKVESNSGKKRIDEPNDHVRVEVETALARENVLMIPVLVLGAEIPSPENLPSAIGALAYRSGLPIRRDPDFKHDMERLIRHMRRALEQGPTPKPCGPAPGEPWENSLGMRFVPVPGTQVLFSIWETRVCDFEAFVEATGNDPTNGTWKKPGFEQSGNHPVVNVNWNDAQAFCRWLTEKEQKNGGIRSGQKFRLPTDHEWSCAVGIGDREKPNEKPSQKDKKIKDVYPWGTSWPPPPGAGNYGISNDGYPRTSPVGSFASNRFGIYDLGGNVWEWCEDKYGSLLYSLVRVLRGASWFDDVPDNLLSSYRNFDYPEHRRVSCGFRCVLVVESSR